MTKLNESASNSSTKEYKIKDTFTEEEIDFLYDIVHQMREQVDPNNSVVLSLHQKLYNITNNERQQITVWKVSRMVERLSYTNRRISRQYWFSYY